MVIARFCIAWAMLLTAPFAALATEPSAPVIAAVNDREAFFGKRLDEIDVIFMRGEYAEALSQLAAVFLQATTEFGPDAIITLRAHNDYAGTLYHSGRLAEAKREFEQVLARFEVGAGEAHPIAIDALNNYANIIFETNSAAEALVLQRRALNLRKKVLGDDDESTVSAWGDLGVSLGRTGALHESLDVAERTLAARRKLQGATHPWTFTAMNNVAHALNLLGRYEAAATIFEETMHLRITHRGARHPETLATQQNLAVALAHLGRFQEARQLRDATLEVQNKELGLKHHETLITRQGISTDLLAQNRVDEAAEVARGVLRDRLLIQSPEHYLVIVTRMLLAEILEQQDALADALDQIDRALAAAAKTLTADHYLRLNTQLSRVRLMRKQGGCSEALQVLPDLFSKTDEQFGPTFPLSIQIGVEYARCLGSVNRVADATAVLASVLDAISASRAAQLGGDDFAQRRLLQLYDEAFRLQAQLLTMLGKTQQAFVVLERSKARALAEFMNDAAAATVAGVPGTAWRGVQTAKEQVRGLNLLLRDVDRPVDRVPIVAQLATAVEAFNRKQIELEESYPRLAATTRTHRATEIRTDGISDDSTYLSYAVNRAGDLSAFTFSKHSGLQWTALGNIPGLADAAEAFRVWTANAGQRKPTDDLGRLVEIVHWTHEGQPRWRVVAGDAACHTLATADGARCRPALGKNIWTDPTQLAQLRDYLSARLLVPLATNLTGRRRLLISPDGALGSLPWDALALNGHVLAASFAISQIHSLPAWNATRERAGAQVARDLSGASVAGANGAQRIALLAIGNPAFHPVASHQAADADKVLLRNRSTTVSLRAADYRILQRTRDAPFASANTRTDMLLWSQLPASQVEMARSAQHFDRQQTKIISGVHATKSAVLAASKSGELASARNLLFATHAYFDPANPHRSAIVLRREGSESGENGQLNVSEIAGLKLDAELTVLSACSTARGDGLDAEGLFGFAYALNIAGSRNALLTMWPVNDYATSEFVSHFFGLVARGANHASALHKTKLWFMEHPKASYRLPKHWAGFVLYGG